MFARRKVSPTPASRSAPKSASGPAPARAARDRRLVSGARVLCRCRIELPRLDPFSVHRTGGEGYAVLNVRGGCFYLDQPFTEDGARRAFPPDRPLALRALTLCPPEGEPVELGALRVRYLKFVASDRLRGVVLRFVGLSETQLDALNGLSERCPAVTGPEERAVPEPGPGPVTR